MLKRYSFLILIAALTGCSSTGGTRTERPEQIVYDAHGKYVTALQVAVAYKSLPSCDEAGAGPLCAKASVIEEVQNADNVAYPILTGAQAAVRAPSTGLNLGLIAKAADEAVKAFKAITDRLRTR